MGHLNFACRAVIPGRAFLRRLIDLTAKVTKPHHHITLTSEARKDMATWLLFLESFNGRPFLLPNKWCSSLELRLESDASGLGFAAILGSHWLQGRWPPSWHDHHITIKELLPIVLAIRVWGQLLQNHRILFLCDNMAVVYIINSQTSRDSNIMCLVRTLVVASMKFNIVFRAKHVPGTLNVIADSLSRFQNSLAFAQAPQLHPEPTSVPESLLPWAT